MKTLKFYLAAFFVALGFVLIETVIFTAACFILAWTFNTIVINRFPSVPTVSIQVAIAFGIFGGLVRTGLNSLFQRKGNK